jgi:hypothetical protein
MKAPKPWLRQEEAYAASGRSDIVDAAPRTTKSP